MRGHWVDRLIKGEQTTKWTQWKRLKYLLIFGKDFGRQPKIDPWRIISQDPEIRELLGPIPWWKRIKWGTVLWALLILSAVGLAIHHLQLLDPLPWDELLIIWVPLMALGTGLTIAVLKVFTVAFANRSFYDEGKQPEPHHWVIPWSVILPLLLVSLSVPGVPWYVQPIFLGGLLTVAAMTASAAHLMWTMLSEAWKATGPRHRNPEGQILSGLQTCCRKTRGDFSMPEKDPEEYKNDPRFELLQAKALAHWERYRRKSLARFEERGKAR